MDGRTARWLSCSKDCWVFMSTPESQQPKPGCEWYQPTTISGRPVCLSISSMFVWKTGSTASTETPVPCWGMANTSVQVMVYSSTKLPSMRPMTSMGTPARPCFSIFSRAREEIWIFSAVSGRLGSGAGPPPPPIFASICCSRAISIFQIKPQKIIQEGEPLQRKTYFNSVSELKQK